MSPWRDLLAAALAAALGAVIALASPRQPASPPPPSAAFVANPSAAPRRPLPNDLTPVERTLAREERARPPELKLAALQAPVREALLPPAAIVDLLDVRPGMAVLDVGAGSGRLAAPLARHVGAAGAVYATDVDPEMVAMLERLAARPGHEALRPSLVSGGVDPLYRTLRLDRALLCSVYEYLEAPIPFLRALAVALRPGGRLLLLQGRSDAHFLASDFERGFQLATLRADPRWAPAWRALPAGLRARLRDVDPAALGAVTAAPLRDELAAAFDALTAAGGLAAALAAAHGVAPSPAGFAALVAPDEALVVAWIAAHERERAFGDPAADRARADLRFRLLLGLFRADFARELYPRGVYLRPEGIERRAAAAGLLRIPLAHRLRGHDALLFAPAPAVRPGADEEGR